MSGVESYATVWLSLTFLKRDTYQKVRLKMTGKFLKRYFKNTKCRNLLKVKVLDLTSYNYNLYHHLHEKVILYKNGITWSGEASLNWWKVQQLVLKKSSLFSKTQNPLNYLQTKFCQGKRPAVFWWIDKITFEITH